MDDEVVRTFGDLFLNGAGDGQTRLLGMRGIIMRRGERAAAIPQALPDVAPAAAQNDPGGGVQQNRMEVAVAAPQRPDRSPSPVLQWMQPMNPQSAAVLPHRRPPSGRRRRPSPLGQRSVVTTPPRENFRRNNRNVANSLGQPRTAARGISRFRQFPVFTENSDSLMRTARSNSPSTSASSSASSDASMFTATSSSLSSQLIARAPIALNGPNRQSTGPLGSQTLAPAAVPSTADQDEQPGINNIPNQNSSVVPFAESIRTRPPENERTGRARRIAARRSRSNIRLPRSRSRTTPRQVRLRIASLNSRSTSTSRIHTGRSESRDSDSSQNSSVTASGGEESDHNRYY